MFRKRFSLLTLTVGVVAMAVSSASAALSGDIVQGGDFESYNTTVKSENIGAGGGRPWTFDGAYTPEEQALVGRANDVGYWVGSYGYITNLDDPRQEAIDNGWVLGTENLGTGNVSLGDGGNHFLDIVGFRAHGLQIIEAPAGHVAGPAEFDFDYFWEEWAAHGGAPRLTAVVYGVTSLPDELPSLTFGNYFELDFPGLPIERLYTAPAWAQDANSETWLNFDKWDNNMPAAGEGVWKTLSDDWDNTFDITSPYPYYLIRYNAVVYHEGDEYFWLYGGKPTDTVTMGFDNFSLKVSVEPTALPGDFDGSGTVDTQDINPFILALTNPGQYQTQYGVDPVVYDTNSDDVINTEDINPFITILTGGGQSAIIPEPASLSLVVLAGFALARRRR